jgi:hypothetical protein
MHWSQVQREGVCSGTVQGNGWINDRSATPTSRTCNAVCRIYIFARFLDQLFSLMLLVLFRFVPDWFSAWQRDD